MRLDIFLSTHHNFSRNKAQQLIHTGLIFVDDILIMKPSFEVSQSMNIRIISDKRIHWVSRSAEKLDIFCKINPLFLFSENDVSMLVHQQADLLKYFLRGEYLMLMLLMWVQINFPKISKKIIVLRAMNKLIFEIFP